MRYFWNSFTCSSLSIVSENSPMPVFVPYMTSLLASFSSSMRRQILMRSRASGASSTFSLFRAIATTFSIVRDEPLRVMDIHSSWEKSAPPTSPKYDELQSYLGEVTRGRRGSKVFYSKAKLDISNIWQEQ